ncbi:MAG: ankyrin repeat domain-containing protein [Verrucomicrobiales bacterium]|nr:ankyrin repeat domain-containing protein [Verrucomicrobiales bacterium]
MTTLSGKLICVLAVSGLFLSSCSDPQKVARKDLEEKGYEVSPRDLFLAAGAGDLESIELFMLTGLDIDTVDGAGNTALIKAASAGQIQAVEKILGLGADPRHINSLGRDALLTASAKGFEDVSRMLMSRGANVDLRDSEGWSALSIAAYNGHSNIVSLLAGQVTSEALDDALLVASFNGDARVITTLLGQGANINARSPESKTPLMISASGGKLQAVRVLLQNQANPYSEDNYGNTAANLAEMAGHEKVHELILTPDAWGATPESLEVAREMAAAKEALVAEAGIEETFEVADAVEGPAEGGTVAVEEGTNGQADWADSGGSSAPQSAGDRKVAAAPAAVGSTRKPLPNRTQIREKAKSKPIVALNGSKISSRSPETAPVQTMVLSSFHEEPLPIAVSKVDGKRAEIRHLGSEESAPIEVAAGSNIPGTEFRVEEVTRKFVHSKEGQGRMMDVSRVKVTDTRTGETHLLVKDSAGQSSDTYAILTSAGSQYRYAVKSGDIFSSSQPGMGEKDYQVLDIRAGAVVIKDLETEEVITVGRDGVIPTH